ncbi:hypothetical protein Krac_3852 [Ktedonobacter racemifer DSM 44963]|uniref:Transposase Synechocystis PCC 6803 domain-containing protein n=2 Tax=Ktedonobacter racemifer TaxID=363277 RepID=D6U3G5_KTERA|nr:hypothetical protein Krac_3852 [Ktedonobacter racemifer DSM 44963]
MIVHQQQSGSDLMNQESTEPTYIALEDAAKELGVNRSTMYYYTKQLTIETKKFPLDKRTYISRADLDRIKSARQSASDRRH